MTPDNETPPVPTGHQVPHNGAIAHPDCRLCGTCDDQCDYTSCALDEQHIAAAARLDRLHRDHRGRVLYPETVTSTREGRIAAGAEPDLCGAKFTGQHAITGMQALDTCILPDDHPGRRHESAEGIDVEPAGAAHAKIGHLSASGLLRVDPSKIIPGQSYTITNDQGQEFGVTFGEKTLVSHHPSTEPDPATWTEVPFACTCDHGVDHCIVHGTGIGRCVVCGQPGDEGEIHGELPHHVQNQRRAIDTSSDAPIGPGIHEETHEDEDEQRLITNRGRVIGTVEREDSSDEPVITGITDKGREALRTGKPGPAHCDLCQHGADLHGKNSHHCYASTDRPGVACNCVLTAAMVEQRQAEALAKINAEHYPVTISGRSHDQPQPAHCTCYPDEIEDGDCPVHPNRDKIAADDPPRFHSGGYIAPNHGHSDAVQLAVEVLTDPKVRELIKELLDKVPEHQPTPAIQIEGSSPINIELGTEVQLGVEHKWRCTSCDQLCDKPDPHSDPLGDPCPMVSWRQETRS